jgi:hypothetical protein
VKRAWFSIVPAHFCLKRRKTMTYSWGGQVKKRQKMGYLTLDFRFVNCIELYHLNLKYILYVKYDELRLRQYIL